MSKLMAGSRNTEVDSVLSQIIAVIIGAAITNNEFLNNLLASMQALSKKISAAIQRDKIESELRHKDYGRGEFIRTIYHLTKGYSMHPNIEIKKSALSVMEVFEKYGLEMINESYSTKSSYINSMVNDYGTTVMLKHISNLSGVGDTLISLKDYQMDFEEYFVGYEKQKAVEGTMKSATEIKKEVVSFINDKLMRYLDGKAIEDEAVYGEINRTIDQIISDNNDTVRRRHKKNNNPEDTLNNVEDN